MISVLSSIFGALVSGAWNALSALVESVPLAVWTHLLAVAAGGAVVAGVALYGGDTSPKEADLKTETLAPKDVPFSEIGDLTLYERPDSVRVDTVRVPASMPRPRQKESGTAEQVARAVDSTADASRALEQAARELTTPDVGPGIGTPSLGYITVPLQGGQPALKITEETATLSGYSPGTGRGLQYEYDVSGPVLEVGPAAWATMPRGPQGATLTPGLVIQYRSARVSAGYAPWRSSPLSLRIELSRLFTLL